MSVTILHIASGRRARQATYVVRTSKFGRLILEAWADRETKDLDGKLEVIVDLELTIDATQDTTPGKDVLDHCEPRILLTVVAGVDGEQDHLCGLAGKAHLCDLASSYCRAVVRVMSLNRSKSRKHGALVKHTRTKKYFGPRVRSVSLWK